MDIKIPLIKKTFFCEQKTKEQLAAFVLSADRLSMGRECRLFEEEFSAWQGRRYTTLCNSGSSANLILIQALKNLGRLRNGDRIGFSALTWATNVMPLLQMGCVPVPLDCDLKTLNVSVSDLEKAEGLAGLFLTNTLGYADDLAGIAEYCKAREILLLEDNCEALGSEFDGVKFGNFGVASTFSFFVGHHMSTIEGGAVCTDDEALHNELGMVRSHGWDRHLPVNARKALRAKHGVSDFYGKYSFYDLAYNVRPTEITGFLGRVQLGHLDEIVSRRERIHRFFASHIAENPEISSLELTHQNRISSFAIPLVFKDVAATELHRGRFGEAGVEVRPIMAGNISRQPFFKKYVSSPSACAVSESIHEQGFYFGNNPDMTDQDLDYVARLLKSR